MKKINTKVLSTESDRFSYRQRMYVLHLMAIILFSLLLIRLIYLQVVLHTHYAERSRKNRIVLQPTAPIRGEILDRNITPLAYNELVHSLEIESNTYTDLYKLVSALSELLDISNEDQQQFYESYFLNPTRYSYSVILKSNLTQEDMMKFSVNQYKFSGAKITSKWQRRYSDISNSSVIGFVGRISKDDINQDNQKDYIGINYIGKQGIEKSYEEMLKGKSGLNELEVTPQGFAYRKLKQIPPKVGKDLVLSIDSRLQNYGYHLFNNRAGALVAIDPTNGDVLSLISSPTFDSNLFVTGIDHRTYSNYTETNALYNRAISGLYPPASTIKPMLSFGALRGDLVVPDEKIYCKGSYNIPDLHKQWYRPFKDWLRSGHGHISMHDAIAQSCDVYFFDIAYRAKIAGIIRTLSWFKFGDTVLKELGGESKGLLPTDQWKRKKLKQPWLPGDTINVGIGQGYLQTTVFQLANAISIIANRGEWTKPRLLIRSGHQGNFSETKVPKRQKIATEKDKEYFELIVKGMVDVISENGTAKNLIGTTAIPIASKTGTAQVVALEKATQSYEHYDHSLFVAFAPVDRPKIVVATIVEHAGSGSYAAGRLTTKFIDYYLEDIMKGAKDGL